jgi:hypothetical protein
MGNPITIDPDVVQRLINQAVEDNILSAVNDLSLDTAWLAKIEAKINQAVVDKTLEILTQTDVNSVIHECVDKNMSKIRTDLIKNFTSTGILDQATKNQIEITDNTVNVKNQLVTPAVNAVDIAVQNLSVVGSINVDNDSWDDLATHISQRTLDSLGDIWKEKLVRDVAEQIKTNGINFDQVSIDGQKLIENGQLSRAVTGSKLRSVGNLQTLQVDGEAHINNNTVNVLNKRLGVNTESPEMALSVWDEEVSVVVGKNRANEAYIGTNRDQGIVIGVNRKPQIEIDATGLTKIKQLQIGLHKISHATQVPGWAGTRGDMVFNASPGADRVFAWVCLGSYNWQVLKSAE